MTESVTVELERGALPETVVAPFYVAPEADSTAAAEVRQRFTCGKGCGFVVNVS